MRIVGQKRLVGVIFVLGLIANLQPLIGMRAVRSVFNVLKILIAVLMNAANGLVVVLVVIVVIARLNVRLLFMRARRT